VSIAVKNRTGIHEDNISTGRLSDNKHSEANITTAGGLLDNKYSGKQKTTAQKGGG
jgi:hypothetical protein